MTSSLAQLNLESLLYKSTTATIQPNSKYLIDSHLPVNYTTTLLCLAQNSMHCYTYTQNKILTIIQLIHRGIKLLKQGDFIYNRVTVPPLVSIRD